MPVTQLTDALNRRYSPRGAPLQHTAGDYITHILAPAGGAIQVDAQQLAAVGIPHVAEVRLRPCTCLALAAAGDDDVGRTVPC